MAPAVVGVELKVNGAALRPVTTGTATVQETEAAVPEVRVNTTLGVVLAPAATVALLDSTQ